MQALHDQFPGALDFYLFCHNEGVKAYHSKGQNKSIFMPSVMDQGDNRIQVQKFRQVKKNLFWGELADLPLKENKRKNEIKQLSIQDEIEQNVLIFRVPSVSDDAFDVFAIQFSKTFSNFYIPSGRNVLSSELKKSIGQTILNQIQWLYDLHKSQQKNVGRIQRAYQQHTDELDEMRQLLEQEKLASRDLLAKYLNQLIQKQEADLGCSIVLKAGFLDKIKNSELPIDQIQDVVNQAALTAYDLAIDPSVIELSPNLIQISSGGSVQTDKTTQIIALDKTEALLNRYEQAARQLAQKSERINGRNLAAELSISSPAVTDAIKKHSSKIKRLLEKYPEKWPLLCDFIRPIREIKRTYAVSQG